MSTTIIGEQNDRDDCDSDNLHDPAARHYDKIIESLPSGDVIIAGASQGDKQQRESSTVSCVPTFCDIELTGDAGRASDARQVGDTGQSYGVEQPADIGGEKSTYCVAESCGDDNDIDVLSWNTSDDEYHEREDQSYDPGNEIRYPLSPGKCVFFG